MNSRHILPLTLLFTILSPLAANDIPAENRTEIRLENQSKAILQQTQQIPTTDNTPQQTHPPTVLNETQLLAQPALLYRALQSALMLKNTENIRVLLPLYQRLPPPHDTILITLCQAMLHHTDGQYDQAITLYRQALASNPEMPSVRFDLAQALFTNHQNEAARDQFIRLRSDTTMPDWVRNSIENYLNELDKRTTWQFYGSINYTQDNNINNSGEAFRLGSGTVRPAPPESAHGLNYRFGAERDWPIHNQWHIRTNLSIDGKLYWDNHPYDDLAIRTEIGPVYQSARTEAAILPYFERRWYGTEPYNRETGIRNIWRHWIAPNHQLNLTAEWGKLHHDTDHHPGRARFDGQSSVISAAWFYIQNPRQYWLLATSYSRRKARDTSQSYTRNSIRIGWTREWSYGLSTSLTAEAAHRQYDTENLFRIRVNQNEYNASLTLWHRRLHFWGITPRLVGTWQKYQGNYPINNHSKANAFIQLSKTF